MTTAQRRLTGLLTVDLPPDRAFRLFTPRGEQDWVPQWKPHFPAGATDDTEPGTVFETHAHGKVATWVVVDREPNRRIRYARVVPQVEAGTITVTLEDVGGRSHVTVTYELTALTESARPHLHEFAERYPAFLRSWQDEVARTVDHAAHVMRRDESGGRGPGPARLGGRRTRTRRARQAQPDLPGARGPEARSPQDSDAS